MFSQRYAMEDIEKDFSKINGFLRKFAATNLISFIKSNFPVKNTNFV